MDARTAMWQLRHAYYLQNRPLCRKYYEEFKVGATIGDVTDEQKQTALTLVTLSGSMEVAELKEYTKTDPTFKFLLAAMHTKKKGDSMDYKEGSKFYDLLEVIVEQTPSLDPWACFRIGAAFMVHDELTLAQTWFKKAGAHPDALAHLVMVYLMLNQFDQALRGKLELMNLPDSEDDIGCSVVRILVAFNPKAATDEVQDAFHSVQELRDKYYPTPATSLWNKTLCAKLNREYDVGSYADENAFEDDDEKPLVPELRPYFLSPNLLNPKNHKSWKELFEAEEEPDMKKYMAQRREELKQAILKAK